MPDAAFVQNTPSGQDSGSVDGNSADAPRLGTSAGKRLVDITVGLDLLAAVAGAVFFVMLARLVVDGTGSGAFAPAIAAGLVQVAATVVSQRLCRTGALREEQPVREQLLEHWWRSAAEIRGGTGSGTTVSLFTDSVERFAQFRQGFLGRQVASGIAPLCVLAVLAVTVDPLIAVILAFVVPLVPLVIRQFGAISRATSTRSRELRGRLANQYLESIQGLETLTLHNAASRVAGELAEAGEDSRKATMALLARNQLVLFVSDAVFSLAMVTLSAALAAWRLSSGAIDPAGAIAVVLCSVLLLAPLDMVASFFYVGMAGRAAQRALRRFLTPPVTSRPNGAGTVANPGLEERMASHLHEMERQEQAPIIQLSGATLGYRGTVVLEDVDFTVPRGGRAVVIGPSGVGKSTLLRALKGDLIPDAGEVSVNGVALGAITQAEVRAASALVAQSTWLFTGSVRDNLALVNPQADEAQLWQALELVDMADFVRRMPGGLDATLGERGQALSGGQTQRISLARAFLSGRELLLLDEPTSQVDLFSEQIIMAALDRLSDDHTIVLVTHRMSALAGASSVWLVSGQALHQLPADEVLHQMEASNV